MHPLFKAHEKLSEKISRSYGFKRKHSYLFFVERISITAGHERVSVILRVLRNSDPNNPYKRACRPECFKGHNCPCAAGRDYTSTHTRSQKPKKYEIIPERIHRLSGFFFCMPQCCRRRMLLLFQTLWKRGQK